MRIEVNCDHEILEDGYTVDAFELIKDWHISGMGETVEQHYQCTVCGKLKREVYIHACTLDDEDNPI